jgi:uncharacterized protein YdbL (DUF1318 family)
MIISTQQVQDACRGPITYPEIKIKSSSSCNLSLSTLGVFGRSSENFDGMLSSLKCDAKYSKYIKKKIVNMCIRTSYYIFCKRNKVWDYPKLMLI